MVAVNRYGLTEVYKPAPATVDVVFVHGLNGDPHNTWTSEKSKTFWPAQLLPPILEEERARILVYGYDADVTSFTDGVSRDKIHNHAEHLVAELAANRRVSIQVVRNEWWWKSNTDRFRDTQSHRAPHHLHRTLTWRFSHQTGQSNRQQRYMSSDPNCYSGINLLVRNSRPKNRPFTINLCVDLWDFVSRNSPQRLRFGRMGFSTGTHLWCGDAQETHGYLITSGRVAQVQQ